MAIHESGHALVAVYSDTADPVEKVTILPAGQTLGVTEQLPLVERHLYGEDHLYDMLAVFLGGRASELVVLGQGSTGAANDLARATDLATKMVREFGLTSALGPVGYPSGGSAFLGAGGSEFSSRPFADETQATIDSEVARILRDAEQKAVGILRQHRDVLDRLVELLVAEETVDGKQIYALAGRTPPTGSGMTMAPSRTGVRRQGPAGVSGPAVRRGQSVTAHEVISARQPTIRMTSRATEPQPLMLAAPRPAAPSTMSRTISAAKADTAGAPTLCGRLGRRRRVQVHLAHAPYCASRSCGVAYRSGPACRYALPP